MRTYYAAEGKLEALHARFRDHTVAIFKKHDMTVVGFWVPVDGTTGAATGNTLGLHPVVSEPGRCGRSRGTLFGADPEWTAAEGRVREERQARRQACDSVFLTPVGYSPLR